MTPDPDLNALPDQARLTLSPDERADRVAQVEAALAAASILPPVPSLEEAIDEDEASDPPDESQATEDTPDREGDEAPPGPPPGVHADVVAPCSEARERFTALSPAAREGFFVVPRVPHGQGS